MDTDYIILQVKKWSEIIEIVENIYIKINQLKIG